MFTGSNNTCNFCQQSGLPCNKPSYQSASDGARDFDFYQCAVQRRAISTACRARDLIESQDSNIRDTLTELFWIHYNSAFNLIQRLPFERDIRRGFGDCYSPLQHLAILAVGMRFADTRLLDIRSLVLKGQRSIFHQVLKDWMDVEGGYEPKPVPQIQVLLILADLEYGFGAEGSAGALMGLFPTTMAGERLLLRWDVRRSYQEGYGDGFPRFEDTIISV